MRGRHHEGPHHWKERPHSRYEAAGLWTGERELGKAWGGGGGKGVNREHQAQTAAATAMMPGTLGGWHAFCEPLLMGEMVHKSNQMWSIRCNSKLKNLPE